MFAVVRFRPNRSQSFRNGKAPALFEQPGAWPHGKRVPLSTQDPIAQPVDEDWAFGYGYCNCGCGQRTAIASRTRGRLGWVKGEPIKWLHGHGRVKNRGPAFTEDPETGCWVWRRTLDEWGYGKKAGRPAHKVLYEELVGEVPDGLQLDHLCRNRACVNPGHLEPVTPQENVRRSRTQKLSEEESAAIRRSTEPGSQVARKYGISDTRVYELRKEYRMGMRS